MNDIEYTELKRQEFVARPHNQGISTVASMITAGGNSTGEHAAPIPPTPSQQEIKGLVSVLRGGRQCDEDGCEIIMSRQACCEAADYLESFILARPDAPSYVWQVAGKTFQMLFATEEDANKWQRFAGMGTASTYIQPIKVPVCTFRDDEAMK